MTDFERKKIDFELRSFASRHLQKPSDCRNAEQIRFYVRELSQKISELEGTRRYVPDWAYTMLAQYNDKQNSFLFVEFRSSYC